jgi:hypothetical protein
MTVEYKINQIVYVILRKESRVYPMQVVKVLRETTSTGETTTYMLRGGSGVDQLLQMDQIDGEVFDSPDVVYKTLLDRASKGINALVEHAKAKATEWYVDGFEQSSADPLAVVKKATPVASAPTKPAKRVSREVAQLASELQQDTDSDDSKAVLELPDGSKVRVNSFKIPAELQG